MTVRAHVAMHACKVGGARFVCFQQRESPHFSLFVTEKLMRLTAETNRRPLEAFKEYLSMCA